MDIVEANGKHGSKVQLRREKMARFNAQVSAERERLRTLDLPLAELVERLHCGNFFTELAAMHWVMVRNETEREAVMAAMLAGLSHPRWKVRRTCADYMDHFGDQRCVDPLLRALNDPREAVRRLALHSLICQQCKTCPLSGDFLPHLIMRADTDRSSRVRQIATGALGDYLHDQRAVAALQRLSAEDADAVVVARARAALTRLAASGSAINPASGWSGAGNRQGIL